MKSIYVLTQLDSNKVIMNQIFFADLSKATAELVKLREFSQSFGNSIIDEKYHDLDGHIVTFTTATGFYFSVSEHKVML